MLTIRRAADRGHSDHGWLDSRHTFSFADYFDTEWVQFRALRVLNDDHVTAGRGFGTHPHRDMEIVSIVLDGSMEHRDSMGNGSVIKAGEVQIMSAGTGVTHSEFNHSQEQGLHFLQIWVLPERQGLVPGYQQRAYPWAEQRGTLTRVVSPDGRDGSLVIHQDATFLLGALAKDQELVHPLAAGRHAWVHVIRGRVQLNGAALSTGDGAGANDEPGLTFRAEEPSRVLVIELA